METYSLDYSNRRFRPYKQLAHRFNGKKEWISISGNKA